MPDGPPRWVDAVEVARVLGPGDAVAALRAALLAGLDPDGDPPRDVVGLRHGQALLMPSEWGGWFGVKVATVAPGNPGRGLPRINGLYLLHDAATLTVRAVLDAATLTALRTPAVSVAAVLTPLTHLAEQTDGIRLVVLGSGPQAAEHVRAIEAHVSVAETVTLGRSDDRTPVSEADVVVCATTAREPLFDGTLVRDDAVVIAVGSHEPDARELDAALLARSTVVVESRAVACREAGDVVLALEAGAIRREDLVPLSDFVRTDGEVAGPVVFKSVGMAWQDLVCAAAVAEALGITAG